MLHSSATPSEIRQRTANVKGNLEDEVKIAGDFWTRHGAAYLGSAACALDDHVVGVIRFKMLDNEVIGCTSIEDAMIELQKRYPLRAA